MEAWEHGREAVIHIGARNYRNWTNLIQTSRMEEGKSMIQMVVVI